MSQGWLETGELALLAGRRLWGVTLGRCDYSTGHLCNARANGWHGYCSLKNDLKHIILGGALKGLLLKNHTQELNLICLHKT